MGIYTSEEQKIVTTTDGSVAQLVEHSDLLFGQKGRWFKPSRNQAKMPELV